MKANKTFRKTSINPTKDQKDQLNKYFHMLMNTSIKERNKQIHSKQHHESPFRRDWNKVIFTDQLNSVVIGQLIALRNKLSRRRHAA